MSHEHHHEGTHGGGSETPTEHDREHHEAPAPSSQSGPARGRFGRLLTRETRFGLAALLSFAIFLSVMILNKRQHQLGSGKLPPVAKIGAGKDEGATAGNAKSADKETEKPRTSPGGSEKADEPKLAADPVPPPAGVDVPAPIADATEKPDAGNAGSSSETVGKADKSEGTNTADDVLLPPAPVAATAPGSSPGASASSSLPAEGDPKGPVASSDGDPSPVPLPVAGSDVSSSSEPSTPTTTTTAAASEKTEAEAPAAGSPPLGELGASSPNNSSVAAESSTGKDPLLASPMAEPDHETPAAGSASTEATGATRGRDGTSPGPASADRASTASRPAPTVPEAASASNDQAGSPLPAVPAPLPSTSARPDQTIASGDRPESKPEHAEATSPSAGGEWIDVPSAGPTGVRPAAAPSPRPARPIAEPVESFAASPAVDEQPEPVYHVVQSGENFWTISRLYYNSGRFYKALWKANSRIVERPDKLYVNTRLRIPPPEELDRSLVEAAALPSSRSAASSVPSDLPLHRTSRPVLSDRAEAAESNHRGTGPADGEVVLPNADPLSPTEMDEPPKHSSLIRRRDRFVVYKVRAFETLRSIARDTLGDSRRADEILELNREVIDDPRHLIPGQLLDLPEDAQLGRRKR